MSKTTYITTPLYYVNAAPHIGHSYTNIAADVYARYHRLKGAEVFLLTGTDEHGQKIEQAASAAGKPPKQYVDEVVEHFRELWKVLNISHDDFIRTTESRHTKIVQAVLTRLKDEGKLVRSSYKGWYCTPDETFWTEAELTAEANDQGKPLCPSCQRELEPVEEDGWHLPMREFQPWLKSFVDAHPNFVRPSSRYNELKGLLENPLPESLCITRPSSRVSWGIQVPFSPEHVIYVWFDALLNYLTAPGYIADSARFDTLWPADMHFIGKDILRHHAIYWPIILHALGMSDEQMPKQIFAHGWWRIGEQKMSKSLGNIVNPTVVVQQLLKDQPFAADVYRYFLLREIPFGQDGGFSEDAIFTRLHSDLGNDLGNLVNRTLSMIGRYCEGKIPQAPKVSTAEARPLHDSAVTLPNVISDAMDRVEFSVALEAIMRVVTTANQYIEQSAPWKLAKNPDELGKLKDVLATLAEVIRIVAITLEPFMPLVSAEIWKQLGCGDQPRRIENISKWPGLGKDQPTQMGAVLFPRDRKKEAS